MKVQFNNIPEGIRGKPLYCLAKLEQKPGKNKPDKIPYQITGARASPNPEQEPLLIIKDTLNHLQKSRTFLRKVDMMQSALECLTI